MKTTNKTEKTNMIKNFFNNGSIILTALSIICALLLIYCISLKSKLENNGNIFVGTIETSDAQVINIHYMTNTKINYFYSDPAIITKNDKVYSYTIGYYVKDNEGNLLPVAKRQGNLDTAIPLDEVTMDMSSWNIAELESQNTYFTKENKKYLDNLYLIIKANTNKDSNESDINLEYKVNVISLTSKD